MQIRMRYFAALREITGRSEEMLTLTEGITAAGVRAVLLEQYPQLEQALKRAVCAINHQYVPSETPLQENDEVVFIPPVGGGTHKR